jgi:transposase
MAPPQSPPPQTRRSATALTAEATAKPTTRSTRSRIIRAKHQPETRAYLDRRIREGKTKREALRSLKRHISRELYHRLTAIPLTS